jgi:hypothetical protein
MKSYSSFNDDDIKDFEIESLLPETVDSLKSFFHYFGIGVSSSRLLVWLFLFEFAALVRFLCGQVIISSDIEDGTTINYTLRRVNYDALSYVDSSYKSNGNTSFLNYKILDNYSAVIEPGQEMELYLYDQTEATIK